MTTHLQAKKAFLEDRDNVGFFGLVGEKYREDGGRSALAVLAPVGGGDLVGWELRDGARLREVLARDDLTRIQGYPPVVANAMQRILGIAAGPAEPPAQIAVLVVYDLEREVLAAEDGQPKWWLFDGEVAERKEPGE